jgi:hypothetical protein
VIFSTLIKGRFLDIDQPNFAQRELEIPKVKSQTPMFGDLVIGAYLEFEAWDLMLMLIPVSKALKAFSPLV